MAHTEFTMNSSMRSTRLAAIDCGTNSIRLLIGELLVPQSAQKDQCHEDNERPVLREILRKNTIIRLGEKVDATGEFAPDALKRLDQALASYAEDMAEWGVVDVMMGATSAARDVSNRDEFLDITARHLGTIVPGRQAEIISGHREAELSFMGACTDIADSAVQDHSSDSRICVIDLGGGSTECVTGRVDISSSGRMKPEVEQAYSADMGCVRITEKFLHNDPPSNEEVAEAQRFIAQKIEEICDSVSLDEVTHVIGVAGTMTTVAALALDLPEYQPERIHMASIPLSTFQKTARAMALATVEHRRSLPVVHPGRADVMGGGCLVIDALADLCMDKGIDNITISEKDILDGMLAEVISRQGTS